MIFSLPSLRVGMWRA